MLHPIDHYEVLVQRPVEVVDRLEEGLPVVFAHG
jgi:hypothetical protein